MGIVLAGGIIIIIITITETIIIMPDIGMELLNKKRVHIAVQNSYTTSSIRKPIREIRSLPNSMLFNYILGTVCMLQRLRVDEEKSS